MKERLFTIELEPRRRLSKCRELVPWPREVCLSCGGPVTREAIGQPALFRHGGYGATRMTAFLVCCDPECRSVRVAAIYEVRPERGA